MKSEFDICLEPTGRTSLRNYPQLCGPSSGPGDRRGVYTTKRTWRMCKALLGVQRTLGGALPSYLITHTASHTWSNERRRAEFRRFLDRLRKVDGIVSYVWVTERHTGGGKAHGLIHHHLWVTFVRPWNYRAYVVPWSLRYAGSVNGLDVQRVRKHLAGYLGKYLAKATGDADELPFRWWGAYKIPRSVRMLWPEADRASLCLRSLVWSCGRQYADAKISEWIVAVHVANVWDVSLPLPPSLN